MYVKHFTLAKSKINSPWYMKKKTLKVNCIAFLNANSGRLKLLRFKIPFFIWSYLGYMCKNRIRNGLQLWPLCVVSMGIFVYKYQDQIMSICSRWKYCKWELPQFSNFSMLLCNFSFKANCKQELIHWGSCQSNIICNYEILPTPPTCNQMTEHALNSRSVPFPSAVHSRSWVCSLWR